MQQESVAGQGSWSTLGLQCLHRVESPGVSVALHARQLCLTLANFMMPPAAKDGVDTMMLRVWSPAGQKTDDGIVSVCPNRGSKSQLPSRTLLVGNIQWSASSAGQVQVVLACTVDKVAQCRAYCPCGRMALYNA